MNKTILLGYVTKKPELKEYENIKICTFSLAVDRGFADKDGNKQTDFINVKVFGKTAENIEKYCDKGSLLAVEGSIRTGSYEKEGKKVYTTDVVAEKIKFYNKPKSEEKVEKKGISDEIFQEFGEQIEMEEEKFQNELAF